MGENDYIDGDDLSAGFGSLGSALFGAGPTFNLGNPTANAAGSESYLQGLLSGETSDAAGVNAASFANGISATMGTLPGEAASGQNTTTSSPSVGSSFGATLSCLSSGGLTGLVTGQTQGCLASGGSGSSASSWFGRGITAILGIVFVIAALYLFGSSNLSDAISSVANKIPAAAAE